MLKHPFLNIPYNPQLSVLLRGIEIYDREHTLGEELQEYNPNDIEDREKIINLYILPALNYLSYRHKFTLLEKLKTELKNENTDFSALFESDYDDPKTIAWDEADIINARGFFERILSNAEIIWHEELKKAASEDQSEW
ncbi:hypothetical protein IF690_02210 [Pseudomonas sp. SK3(2021)]|uniref:hypothetical protein n=1 Tax=Pseudomonas sp. SK3(2021) TaxID=2841064 RepID=UPI00192C92FC|nr:hypothetical protein [Pseudomonas sp. SK3(2021)]QQZ42374.1 hypothetical protein IF690_02210 [Pseudomonas sp. SK3(2021)]